MAKDKLPWPVKCIVIYFICHVAIDILKFMRFLDSKSLIHIITFSIMAVALLKRLEAARRWVALILALDFGAFIYSLFAFEYTFTMSRYIRWSGDAFITGLTVIYLLRSPTAKRVLSKKLRS